MKNMKFDLKESYADDDLIVRRKQPAEATPEVSLGTYLFGKLDQWGDKELFIDNPSDRRWTAREIKNTSTNIANFLLDLGLKDGDRVCGYVGNNDFHALCQLGVYISGAVYVGCYWTNTLKELEKYVTGASVRYILCAKENFERATRVADETKTVRAIIVVDDPSPPKKTQGGTDIYSLVPVFDKSYVNESKRTIPVPLTQSPKVTTLSIMFSSGSTGMPKAIQRTHYTQITYLHDQSTAAGNTFFGQSGKSVLTCHQPLPHMSGSLTVQNCFSNGVKIVFNPVFEVESFFQTVEKHKVTVSMLAPSYMVLIAKSPIIDKYDLSSLKTIATGGAPPAYPIAHWLIKKLGLEAFRQGYGSTECGMVTATPVNQGVTKIESCGIPARGKEIKLIDPVTGETVGPNQVGECLVRSNEVSPGYLDNEQANKDAYTEDGFFRTGDAMYYDEEGSFFVVDRYKEVIKVDTQQVAPPELESILLQHESVAEAAVVGIPSDDHGQVPKAYIVAKSGKNRSESFKKELVNLVDAEVGDWKKLRGGVEFLDSMPKIGMGKIDRVGLKAIVGFNNFH